MDSHKALPADLVLRGRKGRARPCRGRMSRTYFPSSPPLPPRFAFPFPPLGSRLHLRGKHKPRTNPAPHGSSCPCLFLIRADPPPLNCLSAGKHQRPEPGWGCIVCGWSSAPESSAIWCLMGWFWLEVPHAPGALSSICCPSVCVCVCLHPAPHWLGLRGGGVTEPWMRGLGSASGRESPSGGPRPPWCCQMGALMRLSKEFSFPWSSLSFPICSVRPTALRTCERRVPATGAEAFLVSKPVGKLR